MKNIFGAFTLVILFAGCSINQDAEAGNTKDFIARDALFDTDTSHDLESTNSERNEANFLAIVAGQTVLYGGKNIGRFSHDGRLLCTNQNTETSLATYPEVLDAFTNSTPQMFGHARSTLEAVYRGASKKTDLNYDTKTLDEYFYTNTMNISVSRESIGGVIDSTVTTMHVHTASSAKVAVTNYSTNTLTMTFTFQK